MLRPLSKSQPRTVHHQIKNAAFSY